MYIHEIKLTGDNEFVKKFNYVSWLWIRSEDNTLTEEQRDFYLDEHFNSKLSLEQGFPLSYLKEYDMD